MNKVLFPKKDYVKELGRIFKSSKNSQKLVKTLSKYHEKDIAEAITLLTPAERQHIYNVLDEHMIAEIFSYLDDAKDYLEELSLEKAARVVSYMDSDDAVDVLDDLSETKKNEIVEHLDADAKEDVQKLLSYEDDEIGSCMTNNFICIPDNLTIREAMSALVKQAGEHDNISTIYVVNSADKFAGAIDLKDLIIARQNDNLADIISSSYPYVYEHENINECIDKIADYEEDSIPVLTDDGKICGILTATDIVELVDDAMSDDYAKLAGLTSEDDLSEPTLVSIKKRLPWLIILLFLGMAVSSVVGIFESVVAVLPIVICFQSLVLDMAGNVGTQSLAVTIRVLMDETLSAKKKLSLLFKEMKIGFINGASLGIMALVFYLTFNVIGAFLQGILEMGIDQLSRMAEAGLLTLNVNDAIRSLVIDGIFTGVGSVLSFLPIIVTLFFFLSMMEDSGYIARVAFVMDKLLRKIGLSGRSIVPMLIGFGCTVPAVMATRTLTSERDRKMTILLTPFMSCTAKLPIYAFFVSTFFPGKGGLIMSGLYVLGIVVGILIAFLYRGTLFKGEPVPFVMELPNYRLPGAKNVAQLLWEKAKDFLQKAFTVILMATIVVWFLQSFDLHLNLVENSADSILAMIAGALVPILRPLGLGDWRICTALISGFMAKESVVSTLEVLFGGGIASVLTPLSAGVLLVFSLLYTPCVAAVASVKRELGAKWAVGMVFWQCLIAWVVAIITRGIGMLLF